MEKQNYSKLFIIFLAINITSLLVSNIITIKTINILGLVFTAGDILFPITYILNDVFTEVYGFKKAKFTIWLSFFCNLIMVILFWIALKLPGDATFDFQYELETILSITPRVLVASFLAFLIGSFANSIVISKLKIRTKGKYLPLRTITSTIIGEGLDTLVFIPTVFAGSIEVSILLKMILNVFCLKVLLEIILTPITYKVINYIKKVEDIDVYDEGEKYKII